MILRTAFGKFVWLDNCREGFDCRGLTKADRDAYTALFAAGEAHNYCLLKIKDGGQP
jgi:hypothetical protein